MAGLDELFDRIYAAPLARFVATRNAAVKELTTAGRAEDAAALKALRKPPLSAWAVNQLARRAPGELAALVQAHDDIASATDPDGFRGASERRKELVARLTEAARAILIETGHAATQATVLRISQDLLAAPAPEHRAALLAGRLSGDLGPEGFTGMALPDLARGVVLSDDDRALAAAEELERAATAAEDEARRAEQEAEAAETKARLARSLAVQARRRAEEAQQRAAEARRSAGGS